MENSGHLGLRSLPNYTSNVFVFSSLESFSLFSFSLEGSTLTGTPYNPRITPVGKSPIAGISHVGALKYAPPQLGLM